MTKLLPLLCLLGCAPFIEPSYGTINVRRVHPLVYEVTGTGYHMQVEPGCRLADGWVFYTENEELRRTDKTCRVTMVYPSPPPDWKYGQAD